MIEAIGNRRSIRKFAPEPIPREAVLQILEAGIKAPSAKNRQPWKFIAVQGKAKPAMLAAFRQGLEQERTGNGLLPHSKLFSASAENTLEIMAQAPLTVFVLNTKGKHLCKALGPEERIYEAANLQSIGAAIQNMLLAATEIGVGSLWICDVFFAYEALEAWLGVNGEMVAAVSFGYALESPAARPRKALVDVLEWRE